MNHLLIGAALPYLLACLVYAYTAPGRRLQLLIWGPVAISLCALWAVVPDIPRGLGMYSLYMRMAESPASNLFFFHHAIDARESESPLHLLLFLGLAGSVLLAAWRELLHLERSDDA